MRQAVPQGRPSGLRAQSATAPKLAIVRASGQNLTRQSCALSIFKQVDKEDYQTNNVVVNLFGKFIAIKSHHKIAKVKREDIIAKQAIL